MAVEQLYPDGPHWEHLGLGHMQRYQFAIPWCKGLRVLDLACGCGFGSYVLARHASARVTGVDRSSEAIAYAQRMYSSATASFECSDVANFSAVEPFDVAVSFETFEHLPDTADFVLKLHSSLKPGGLLIISAPNTRMFQKAATPVENEFHISEPTYEEFITVLRSRFEIMEEWEQSAWPVMKHPVLRAGWKRWFKRTMARLCSGALAMPASPPVILPLLPERRDRCEQFLFVCRAQ
jgi:SAM-dependent methyltransferase